MMQWLLLALSFLLYQASGDPHVSLSVDAVNSFTGEHYKDARIVLRNPTGKKLCEGRGSLIDCSVAPGRYRLSVSRTDFETSYHEIQLVHAFERRQVSLWPLEPREDWVNGELVRHRYVRFGRLEGLPVAELQRGYWVRVSAIHDSFLQAHAFSRTTDFKIDNLPPGLYQVVVNVLGRNPRLYLLRVNTSCSVFNLPAEDRSEEIVCR